MSLIDIGTYVTPLFPLGRREIAVSVMILDIKSKGKCFEGVSGVWESQSCKVATAMARLGRGGADVRCDQGVRWSRGGNEAKTKER